MTANFKQALREVPDMEGHDFKRVDVTIDSNRFTLLPLDFFDDDQAANIYNRNLTRQDNETVKYNILPVSNVVVLFGIDKALYNLLKERYSDVHFSAHVSQLISLATNGAQGRKKMLCYVDNSSLTIVAAEGSSLLQANAHNKRSISDLLYYTLLSWKQLQFSQTDDRLVLTGNEKACRQLAEQAARFIKNVETASEDELMKGIASTEEEERQ